MPISPVAPCTQVGWGVVNMSNIQPMIEHLNGSQAMPDRPGDVELCMQVNQEAQKPTGACIPPKKHRLARLRSLPGLSQDGRGFTDTSNPFK